MTEVAATLLPWHRDAWRQLQQARSAGRLHHALLLCGPEGTGKRRLASLLAASLVCEQPTEQGEPCGLCHGCRLHATGAHPDLTLLEPEEPGKPIRVAAVRELTAQSALTSQGGGYKVITLVPADALNISAANGLLKTLEEPVPNTLIIMVTDAPQRLPATIRSRCQRLEIGVPDAAVAAEWLAQQGIEGTVELPLALAAGAPLRALSLADPELLKQRGERLAEFAALLEGREDPVSMATRWAQQELKLLIGWYIGWLVDVIRLQCQPDYPSLINPDSRNILQAIGNSLESSRLHELLGRAYQALAAVDSQLNRQLMIEAMLLELAQSSSNQPTERA